MTWLSAPVSDFRSKRKCFSISGSFLLVLLLLVSQTACRPQDDDVEAVEGLPAGDEYADVDNVEFHHVKIVDGVMHEDHPVIMYKEDFVSEDYDPSKNQRNKSSISNYASLESSESSPSTPGSMHLPRKYKDIAHRRRRIDRIEKEQYRALKPEKIYFDVLSPAPVVASDESSANDSKFDTSKIRVEVISLADDEAVNEKAKNDGVNDEDAEPNKQILKKHPKKYHNRVRRDISAAAAAAGDAEDQRHKRNIFWRPVGGVNSVEPVPSNRYLPPVSSQSIYYKYSVPGNFYNGIDKIVVDSRFGDEKERDRVVWRDLTPKRDPATRRVTITRRPARPVFREPQEENSPLFTRRPVTATSSAGAPAGGASGGFSRPASTPRPSTTARPNYESEPEPEDPQPPVSTCVWAIAQCCSGRDNNIRYRCFESFGCNAVFWGQNPCADRIRDNVVDFLANVYNE